MMLNGYETCFQNSKLFIGTGIVIYTYVVSILFFSIVVNNIFIHLFYSDGRPMIRNVGRKKYYELEVQ